MSDKVEKRKNLLLEIQNSLNDFIDVCSGADTNSMNTAELRMFAITTVALSIKALTSFHDRVLSDTYRDKETETIIYNKLIAQVASGLKIYKEAFKLNAILSIVSVLQSDCKTEDDAAACMYALVLTLKYIDDVSV